MTDKNIKVLIVEDEVIIAKDIEFTLKEFGYDVLPIVSESKAALESVKNNKPSVILMDIMIEGKLNGIETAHEIKKIYDAPIIYLTAYSDETTIQKAKMTNPAGYLLKPFVERELYSIIEMALYRHKIENELKENKQWLELILGSIGDAVIAVDTQRHIKFSNLVARKMLSVENSDIKDKAISDVYHRFDMENRSKQEVEKCFENFAVLNKNRHFVIYDKNHREIFIEETIFPLKGDCGDIKGFVVVFRDVSEKNMAYRQLKEKQKELEILNNELKQLNRTLEKKVEDEVSKNRERDHIMIQHSRQAALGEMIGNIAHQWRQPLNALTVILEDLRESYCLGELSESYFDKSIKQASSVIQHMSSTIDDFRNFFRIDKKKSRFGIVDTIQRTLVFMDIAIKDNNIEIEINYDKDVYVLGNQNEFCQAVMNIFNNAVDAFEERNIPKPKIVINLCNNNDLPVLEIRDNAGGIDNSVINNVFEPYFTTKEPGKGTGIGLYITKTIIEESLNAQISAHNVFNGACFKIEFK